MTIITGDCLEVMKTFPDNHFDLCITSPPYDNLRTCYESNFAFENIAKEIFRVLKIGSILVWVVGDSVVKGSETGTSFKQALFFKDVIGFKLHDTMIYEKAGIVFPESVRYYNSFEYMFVFSKGFPKTVNLIKDRINKSAGKTIHGSGRQANGLLRKKSNCGKILSKMGVRFNIWRIPNSGNSVDRNGHPAPFPLALARDHILSWSNEGDLVLDPFVGSGTTCVASLQTDRNSIGIEKDPEYADIARARVAHAKSKKESSSDQMELFG